MTRSLYISASGPRAGKSIAALGVMDLLARTVKKIGVFRPILSGVYEKDPLVEVLIDHYNLSVRYEEACPFTYSDMQVLLGEGELEKVQSLVVSKYQAFAKDFDFVLVIGTDFVGPTAATELELNATLAANLASPVLMVMNGADVGLSEIDTLIDHASHVLTDNGCVQVASIVNRVKANMIDVVRTELQQRTFSAPVYALEDVPVLAALTVGEVAAGLHGTVVAGTDENMQREVERYVAGSGHVPMVLELLEAGVLLIAAGDRSDLAVAAAAVASSQDMPSPAGLVLTCGVIPDEKTIHLLRSSGLPVIAVTPDTYQTLHTLDQIPGEIRPRSRRKILAALSEFTKAVNEDELIDRIELSKSTTVTPLMFTSQIMEMARSNKQRIVLPESQDERILKAADELLHGGICDITLLGDEENIGTRLRHLGLDLTGVEIINPDTSTHTDTFAEEIFRVRSHKGVTPEQAVELAHDPTYFATMLVHLGFADGMVSGATHTTAETIRPALQIIKTVPGTTLVSSVFLMCLPEKVWAFADCAVNPEPTAEELVDIASSTVDTARAFGINPKVAMLSYSTGTSGTGVEVDKVRTATELLMKRRPELEVAGPIQYDAAVDEEVGKTKLPGNPVAGSATVFIFPDLNSGNTAYKAVQRSADAIAIGPILQGLAKPINDLSRGCTIPDIVSTVAITAIQSQVRKRG
ncbi:MAG: phosphate acetyltransferase [Candidatus Nanopelagicales bacterium]